MDHILVCEYKIQQIHKSIVTYYKNLNITCYYIFSFFLSYYISSTSTIVVQCTYNFIFLFCYIYIYVYTSEFINYFSACCFSTPLSEGLFPQLQNKECERKRIGCVLLILNVGKRNLQTICRLSSANIKKFLLHEGADPENFSGGGGSNLK